MEYRGVTESSFIMIGQTVEVRTESCCAGGMEEQATRECIDRKKTIVALLFFEDSRAGTNVNSSFILQEFQSFKVFKEVIADCLGERI